MERMTDALALRGLGIRKHGRDVLITGYLPPKSSTGALAETEEGGSNAAGDAWIEDPLGIVESRGASGGATGKGGRERRIFAVLQELGRQRRVVQLFAASHRRAVGVGRTGGRRRGETAEWPTVEHFYQAQKFGGVDDPAATSAMEAIRAASSPEEAARIGRTLCARTRA